jgi:prefoldin subunit 5
MRLQEFLKEDYTMDNWSLEDATFRLEQARAQMKMIEAELKILSKKPLPKGDIDKKRQYDTKIDTLKTRLEAVNNKIKNFSEKISKIQDKMRGNSDRRASR